MKNVNNNTFSIFKNTKRYYGKKKPFIIELFHSVKPSNSTRVRCNKLSGAFKKKGRRFLILMYKDKQFFNKKTSCINPYNIYATIKTDDSCNKTVIKDTNSTIDYKMLGERTDTHNLKGRFRQLELTSTNKELEESNVKELLFQNKENYVLIDKDDCGYLSVPESDVSSLQDDIIDYYTNNDE